jgi:ABC-type multidrug transport system ATPase subunit
MADRIGIFHQGQVIACGSADELRARSQTTGTLEAAFLALTRGSQTQSEEA